MIITIQKEDKTTYKALFEGEYYTIISPNGTIQRIPSIAKKLPNGKWTHGMLGENERIIA
jgi:hypothetical protein